MTVGARRRVVVGAGVAGVAVAGVAAAAYVRQRRAGPHPTPGLGDLDEGRLALSRRLPPPGSREHLVELDDGGRLRVVEQGDGPALVLVHGVTLGAGVWAPQLHQLSAGHRVIAVDQRGHGASVAGRAGYTLERLADDLAQVLVHLDVADAVLVGHSMGGMVSQLFALRHPDELRRRVAGLVLVATAASTPMSATPGRRLRAVATTQATQNLRRAHHQGKGIFPHEELGAWATRLTFGRRPDPLDVELTRSIVSAMSSEAMAELLGPLLTYDVRDRLGQITVPTRVVVGTRDLLTPPRLARVMAAGIPGAALVVYPGCGHMVMLERPVEFNALLADFAATLQVPTGR